jgi:hypothetical protein
MRNIRAGRIGSAEEKLSYEGLPRNTLDHLPPELAQLPVTARVKIREPRVIESHQVQIVT